jgi:septal ring factor EnvC (AmiA/AmiB activator)
MSTGFWVAVGSIASGLIGSVLTYFAQRGAAKTASIPDLINALSNRLMNQEKRITKMEQRQEALEGQLSQWKTNYFKLLRWLKDFFKKNGIDEEIPEFHLLTDEDKKDDDEED